MKKMVNGIVIDMTAEEITEAQAEEAGWNAGQSQRDYDEAVSQRVSRYTSESDRLFMEWQYDGTAPSEALWRAAVAQIKTDIPLPVV